MVKKLAAMCDAKFFCLAILIFALGIKVHSDKPTKDKITRDIVKPVITKAIADMIADSIRVAFFGVEPRLIK